jgi:hypothetical protein
MNLIVAQRRAATARAIAAAALLREAEEEETRSARAARHLVELAFLQLVRAAEAIEPVLTQMPTTREIVN